MRATQRPDLVLQNYAVLQIVHICTEGLRIPTPKIIDPAEIELPDK